MKFWAATTLGLMSPWPASIPVSSMAMRIVELPRVTPQASVASTRARPHWSGSIGSLGVKPSAFTIPSASAKSTLGFARYRATARSSSPAGTRTTWTPILSMTSRTWPLLSAWAEATSSACVPGRNPTRIWPCTNSVVDDASTCGETPAVPVRPRTNASTRETAMALKCSFVIISVFLLVIENPSGLDYPR